MKIVLETMNLKKYYTGSQYVTKALDDVNIKIIDGEFVTVVGKSGSGKSTLLHMLGALDRPTDGNVIINGIDVFKLKNKELAKLRRQNIGFIFQYYNLIPYLNVWENIVLPLGLDGQKVEQDYINDIIDMLGLEDKKKITPNKLSGGQQQRVAIARALASKPAIILADEPTGNLDSSTEEEVINLLRKSKERYNQTLVMITHDETIAQAADRYIMIKDGKVMDQ